MVLLRKKKLLLSPFLFSSSFFFFFDKSFLFFKCPLNFQFFCVFVNWLSWNRCHWHCDCSCDWAHNIVPLNMPMNMDPMCPPRIEPRTCWSAVSRSNHWAMYPCPEFSLDHHCCRRNTEFLQILPYPEPDSCLKIKTYVAEKKNERKRKHLTPIRNCGGLRYLLKKYI